MLVVNRSLRHIATGSTSENDFYFFQSNNLRQLVHEGNHNTDIINSKTYSNTISSIFVSDIYWIYPVTLPKKSTVNMYVYYMASSASGQDEPNRAL